MAFVKLHGSILNSSVWLEDMPTRLVWLTMLVMANEDGVVEASVGGLAHQARVTKEDCEAALAVLAGQDPDSRDGTTGERIEKVPGGWLVLNHSNYRERRTSQQIATAERVARHRSKLRKNVTVTLCNDVTPCNGLSPSEAEAESRCREELHGSTAAEPLTVFVNDLHRDAYLAYRAGHTRPKDVDAVLQFVNAPITGGRRFDWPTIGSALVEMRGASANFSAVALRAFCERLERPPRKEGRASSGKHGARQEQNLAAIEEWARKTGGENG